MSWSCLSLSCHCITLASSTSPESNHTGRTKSPNRSKQRQLLNLSTKQPNNISDHQKQLSIMEMERAIGAGTFRDNQPRQMDLDKNKIVFNGILPDFSGMFEGPLEKQIRHTGEWVATTTEQGIRSSRKGILMVIMQWILPIWTLSLLLASGAVNLPFSTPFLDNLIM